MTTLQDPLSAELPSKKLSHGKLPRFTPVVLFVVSLAVMSGVLAVFDAFSIPLAVVLGVVLFAAAIMALSRAVEGSRSARDRLATTVMYSAFGLALIPLVSLLWTVLQNGLKRFDLYFLTYTMRGVYGGMDAGGAYHAIVGTLEITVVRDADLRADRAADRDLPGRVRPDPARSRHHVLRGRDDRHPVDRRRPVRLRAVRACSSDRACAWAWSARSRCRC